MRLHRINSGRGGYSDLVDLVTHTAATGNLTRAVALARVDRSRCCRHSVVSCH